MKLLPRIAHGISRRWWDWMLRDYIRERDGNRLYCRNRELIDPATEIAIAFNTYEHSERRLLAYMRQHGHIASGDRVLEGGGGLGVLTMDIAEIVGDDAVVVFEPNPRTAAALRGNLSINRHNIRIEQAALIAEARSEVTFYDTTDSAGFLKAGIRRTDPRAKVLSVRAVSLSDAIAQFEPSVLMLDVEGAEYDLLASIRDWGRARSIHLETHPELLSEEQIATMLDALKRCGFSRDLNAAFGAEFMLLTRPIERLDAAR